DRDSSAAASSKIIVVNIRVTPERLTVPDQNTQTFNITGGTPPYEISSLQGGVVQYSPGESNFTFSPPAKDGIYTIEIKDKNSSKAYTTVELASEGVPVLPLDASRAAIIVAGGPPDVKNNTLWPLVKIAAEKIYRVLTRKGFTQDQIYLLSPIDLDGDGDGFPDSIIRNTQGYLEEKYIQTAFQWAGQLKNLDQPLLIFLLGHGIKDKFMLNLSNKTLDANKLSQYLDEYQKVTGKDVVVVMDSCYSGSFIDDLAGPGRAVITSTGNENKAFYAMKNSVSLSSFFSYFSDGISSGVSLLASYNHACDNLKKFYSQEMCSKQYDTQQIFFQNPQYEDNGDGKYYDLFMNLKTEDGLMLKNIYINKPSSSAIRSTSAGISSIGNRFSGEETNTQSELSTISDMTLSIVSMNSQVSETFSPRDTITLKAKVGLAQGSVKSVYGILKPPGIKIPIDENGISHLSYPQIKLSKIDEELNLESYNSQIWETKWNGAVYQGCYELNFYAQSENGSVAFSDAISFSVYDAPQPPDKPEVEIVFNVIQDNYNASGESSENTSHEYSPGDKLNISIIEHLNWGYDLYAAIVIPDGTTLLSFSGLNQLKAFTGSEESIFKWQEERYQDKQLTILDIEIPKGLPNGKYQVYAVMVPQGKSIFDNADYFILSASSFAIQP
ncbi:MAG: hypothetical protein HQK69_11125, partial [Desulfamplus sp.]|nr:hypothetical protein [Desulfamplus sp.]